MSEYELFITEMEKKTIGWELKLLQSLKGWNPRKIDTKWKKVLINVSLTKLSEEEIERLKENLFSASDEN